MATKVALFGLSLSAPLVWKVRNLLIKDDICKDPPKDANQLISTLLNDLRQITDAKMKEYNIKINPLREEYLGYAADVIQYAQIQINALHLYDMKVQISDRISHAYTEGLGIKSKAYDSIEKTLVPILKDTKDKSEKALLIAITTIGTVVDFIILMARDIKMGLDNIVENALNQAVWVVQELKKAELEDWKRISSQAISMIMEKMGIVYKKIVEFSSASRDTLPIDFMDTIDIFSLYKLIAPHSLQNTEAIN